MFSKSSRGRPENVLGTSQINLPETSVGRHFETSPGRQIRTSRGRQFGTFPGWSNRCFRGRPGDISGGSPRDVLGTNIYWLDNKMFSLDLTFLIVSSFQRACIMRTASNLINVDSWIMLARFIPRCFGIILSMINLM